MLISMTGYGKAVVEPKHKKVSIEIKSLNSKQLDINTRIANIYKEKELIFRNQIKTQIGRGKIELSIFLESVDTEKATRINKPIILDYYQQLENIANELNIPVGEETVLQTLTRLPDALITEQQELDEEEWQTVFEGFKNAIAELNDFRKQEGAALASDIFSRIHQIETLLTKVPQFEEERIENLKSRINDNLSDFIEKQNVDKNRFEQELIYYLEKLDITEEKVRLANHCKYFMETAQQGGAIGKKLGFITQEIGREINTLGSKANHSEIQKIVIQMKDELEKIKEQLLNVL